MQAILSGYRSRVFSKRFALCVDNFSMKKIFPNPDCPGCAALSAEVDQLKGLVSDLQQQVRSLQAEAAKARKNSSNSSKPPSSDIVKPNKPASKGRRRRKTGGQPGHTKSERTFDLLEADLHHTYTLEVCPNCAGAQLDLLDVEEKVAFQF